MTLPVWRDWLFSGKAFLASMLALYIALAFDLPRPYWAMAAVYVVSNPLAGATSSKALYRALGTLIGASASVLFVPLFVSAPVLLSLVVAVWTGVLLYVSMLDRTPRSYVFMLAGYTLPLIALPTVGAPDTVFDVAVARSEEIILGITCAAIVGNVVFPASTATALADRIGIWLRDAAGWAEDILRGEGAVPRTPLKRQQLAADVAGLDLVISQLAYDARGRDVVGHAQQLRSRLLMLLPTFSSLADRLHALQARNPALLAALRPELGAIADWLRRGAAAPQHDEAERLQRALSRLEPPQDRFSWDNLVLASALTRLREIVGLWQDCLALHAQLARGRADAGWRPALRHRRLLGRVRHHDFGLLAFSAGCVVLATFAAGLFWIYSGWQDGASFVMMCAVAGSFFAAMDRPAQAIVRMFAWCAVSLVASGVYLFGILPAIHGYAMLVLVFVGPFLLIGTLIPRPQTNLLAMLLTVNTASFVALQNRYAADFTTFANSALAALAGLGFALVFVLVTRPFGAELAARRLARAGWRDLADAAASGRRRDQARLAARMLDRLGQIVPRLATADSRDLAGLDGLAEIRVGYNVLELQRQRRRLGEAAAACLLAVLAEVAVFYRARVARGAGVAPPDALRLRIDHALRIVRYEGHRRARKACDALVGLRRALFPDAAAPDDDIAGEPMLPIAAE